MISAVMRCPVLRAEGLPLKWAKRCLAGLAFAGAIAGPAAAFDPSLWKDWMAGCDQAKRCRAVALPPQGVPDGLMMVIDRDSGPTGQLTVRLTVAEGMQPGLLKLTIDGKLFEARVLPDTDSARWDGGDALAVARALAAGRRAEASQDGKALGAVPLAGASAALLFVDDAQRRLGTKGAFVRQGRKADDAAAVIRPTLLPYSGLRTAPAPLSLAGAVRKQGALAGMDCDPVDKPTDAATPLDASTTLILLECDSGAYNLVQRAFLVRDGKAATAQPVLGELAEGVTNADFDARYRTLGGLTKGRGVGDCGSIDRWAWTGKAFVRAERSVMDACRGVPPQWWITVDRSALAVAL